MKVVILCGGRGTRMGRETQVRPKPMVSIGGRPILWHIMKIYAHYGFQDFLLCLGYKGEVIKRYFLDYEAMNRDFTIELGQQNRIEFHNGHGEENFSVTLADTGPETPTGGRVKRIEKYIDQDTFLVTYGDGVADVDINALLDFHRRNGKIATVTGVQPFSRFGVVHTDDSGLVTGFREKPQVEGTVSGGFFVFNRAFFDYLQPDSVLETTPLEQLAQDRELALYRHDGFWQCMDTPTDHRVLNELWKTGRAPWKVWK
ncbi:MAG: glucose-1-phosphate cytidylyltransferase [Anaerolineaceae bacterium 4572_32.1]|nr:MAG: glucose-1-phosphate cytidylyltransferase [Anaerolineaceae bacterium 4572_32.1]